MNCFQTFNLHEGPVTCLQYNPQDLTLASGSKDKTVKYWDLDNFSLVRLIPLTLLTSNQISSTKKVQSQVTDLLWSLDGKQMFSASNETVKVWDLENSYLVDNIMNKYRGVLDMAISKTN